MKMSVNRLRLILGMIVVMAMVLLMVWSQHRKERAEIEQTLVRMDRDAKAAQAAAIEAQASADRAGQAAIAARNALPGSF
jgi:FtsZ-interacting cell division protein ZipA